MKYLIKYFILIFFYYAKILQETRKQMDGAINGLSDASLV